MHVKLNHYSGDDAFTGFMDYKGKKYYIGDVRTSSPVMYYVIEVKDFTDDISWLESLYTTEGTKDWLDRKIKEIENIKLKMDVLRGFRKLYQTHNVIFDKKQDKTIVTKIA